MIDIEELEKLAEAATPGPWKLCHHWTVDSCPCGYHRGYLWHPDGERVLLQMGCGTDEEGNQAYPDVGQDGMRADARFVAAARTAIPALCAEVRRLRDERDRAVAKLGVAVAALEEIAENSCNDCGKTETARDALARIGGGK